MEVPGVAVRTSGPRRDCAPGRILEIQLHACAASHQSYIGCYRPRHRHVALPAATLRLARLSCRRRCTAFVSWATFGLLRLTFVLQGAIFDPAGAGICPRDAVEWNDRNILKRLAEAPIPPLHRQLLNALQAKLGRGIAPAFPDIGDSANMSVRGGQRCSR